MMIAEIERHCNNYFNPDNDLNSPIRDHPPDFLELVSRIEQFRTENKPSILSGESVIGVYIRSRAMGANGVPISWQQVFAGELAPFKRARFI